jgi:hypothetical protein
MGFILLSGLYLTGLSSLPWLVVMSGACLSSDDKGGVIKNIILCAY